jgi:hypothetical protein
MKKLFVFLCFVCALAGYAQNAKTEAPKYTTTYYSFKIDEVSDQDKLNDCAEAVKQLKYVSEIKAKYKPESKKAEMVIVVIEKNRTSENDDEFSLSDVKKTIIRFGFAPAGFTVLTPQTN